MIKKRFYPQDLQRLASLIDQQLQDEYDWKFFEPLSTLLAIYQQSKPELAGFRTQCVLANLLLNLIQKKIQTSQGRLETDVKGALYWVHREVMQKIKPEIPGLNTQVDDFPWDLKHFFPHYTDQVTRWKRKTLWREVNRSDPDTIHGWIRSGALAWLCACLDEVWIEFVPPAADARTARSAWDGLIRYYHKLAQSRPAFVLPTLMPVAGLDGMGQADQVPVSIKTLFTWFEQREPVLISGEPGAGKKDLLEFLAAQSVLASAEHAGFRQWLPVLISHPDEICLTEMDIVRQLGLAGLSTGSFDQLERLVADAVESRRLLFLINQSERERWSLEDLRKIVIKTIDWKAALVVAAPTASRQPSFSHHLSISWHRRDYQRLFEARAQLSAWPKVLKFLNARLIAERYWEIDLISRSSDLETGQFNLVEADVSMVPGTYLKKHMKNAVNLRHLRDLAWQLTTHPEEPAIRTLSGHAGDAQNQAVKLEILQLVPSRALPGQMEVRFTHPLWRLYLAGVYLASQSTEEAKVGHLKCDLQTILTHPDAPQIISYSLRIRRTEQPARYNGYHQAVLDVCKSLIEAAPVPVQGAVWLHLLPVIGELKRNLPHAENGIAETLKLALQAEDFLINQLMPDWLSLPFPSVSAGLAPVVLDAVEKLLPLSSTSINQILEKMDSFFSTAAEPSSALLILDAYLLSDSQYADAVLHLSKTAEPIEKPPRAIDLHSLPFFIKGCSKQPGSIEKLLTYADRADAPSPRWRLTVKLLGLCLMGTPAAAQQLAVLLGHCREEWLMSSRPALERILKHWEGDPDDLWNQIDSLVTYMTAHQVLSTWILTAAAFYPDGGYKKVEELIRSARLPEHGRVRAAVKHTVDGWRLEQALSQETIDPQAADRALPDVLQAYLTFSNESDLEILLGYPAEMVDRYLQKIDLKPYQVIQLCQLGTPVAVETVLRWRKTNQIQSLQPLSVHIGTCYRDEVFDTLAGEFRAMLDEFPHYQVMSALRKLWESQPIWPWKVMAFFLDSLADPDSEIREDSIALIREKLWGNNRPLQWNRMSSQMITEYCRGCRSVLKNENRLQQLFCIEIFAAMPGAYAGEVEPLSTSQLQTWLMDPQLSLSTMLYIVAHRRSDLAQAVTEMINAIDFNRLPSLLPAVALVRGVGAILTPDTAGSKLPERLLMLAFDEGIHPMIWQAAGEALLYGPAFQSYLLAQVQENRLNRFWYTCAAALQGANFA